MIAVQRRAKPTKLQTDAATWTQELCQARADYYAALEARSANPTLPKPEKPRAVANRYGHIQVKRRLKEMFHGKCCYCETSVEVVAPRHVEHFFPASVYPSLAYNWDNLLFACFVCNSTYKSDHFPIGVGELDASEDPLALTVEPDASIRLLLDPCRDRPEEHFTFDEGRIIALTQQGRLTRVVCGLDRQELNEKRFNYIQLIRYAIKDYKATGNPEARVTLKNCCEMHSEYAAMVRVELARHDISWQAL